MSEASAAKAVKQSSLLLNLPVEILNLILTSYFEHAALVVVSSESSEYNTEPRIVGMPSLSLERTCRAMHKESLAARTECVTQELVVEDTDFLRLLTPKFLEMNKLKWVREHVSSLWVKLLEASSEGIDWDSFVWGFPRLKSIEFNHQRMLTWSQAMLQHFPLDSDEGRRRFAKLVVTGKWMGGRSSTGWVTGVMGCLEDAYHDARNCNHFRRYVGPLAGEVSIRFRLDVNARGYQSGKAYEIYSAASLYKSGGWMSHDFNRELVLISLYKTCKVGNIEETLEGRLSKE